MKEKEVVESTTKEEAVNTTALAMSDVATNIFGESKRKVKTTLNPANEEEADMLLNSSQEVDFKLNDEIGKEIEVMGCTLSESEVENMNEETGEVTTRKKHTVMLFDTNGKSHVSGSNACYMSFIQIISVKGLPSRENPLTLIPVKVQAQEKGHEWLRLKIKTNK